MDTDRESTDTVTHPAHLWGWTRVDKGDHPTVAALYDGAPDLGWSPDSRLCMYKNEQEGRYCLVRLEGDEEYRMICRSQPFELLTGDKINRMIRDLIAHDRQRGFDAMDATVGYNTRKREASEREFSEMVREDLGDKLYYAFGRAYLPGVDILPRQAPSRR